MHFSDLKTNSKTRHVLESLVEKIVLHWLYTSKIDIQKSVQKWNTFY